MTVIAALLVPCPAVGQPRQESHAPIPPAEDRMPAKQLIEQRFNQLSTSQLLAELKKRGGVPDAALQQRLEKDPLFADVLQRIANNDPQIMALVDQVARSHPEFRGLNPSQLRQQLPGLAQQYMAGQSPAVEQPIDPERQTRQLATERLNDFIRDWKLEGVAEQLRDSPALRDMMNEVSTGSRNLLAEPGTYKLPDLDWKRIGNWVRNLKHYLPGDLPQLAGLRANELSRMTDFGLGGIGRPSGPDMSGLAAGWSAYAALAVVAVAMFILWKYARLAGTLATQKSPSADWPKPPARVESLADFILAFEYVVLRRLGATAAHWHHRLVAEQLSAVTAEAVDAKALSALYEHARYAPACAAPASWDSVRAALARLGGGSA